MPGTNNLYRWEPGRGADARALERMRHAFPRPKEPMGEAWFMGERTFFPELLGDLDALTDEQLDRPLIELASGPASFGPQREWTLWYHYLLPRLLERPWAWSVFHPAELLFTGFMTQHPEPIRGHLYRAFRADALATLGRYIMSPHFWPEGRVDVVACLGKVRWPDGLYRWADSGALLSASLFFCLKYLDGTAIAPWFESVLAIPDPHWKAQIIVWLVGAHPILTGAIDQPAQFCRDGFGDVAWNWSHCLSGNYSGNFEEPIARIPFLPPENREALFLQVRGTDLTEFLAGWQTDPELARIAAETAGVPERFAELYG